MHWGPSHPRSETQLVARPDCCISPDLAAEEDETPQQGQTRRFTLLSDSCRAIARSSCDHPADRQPSVLVIGHAVAPGADLFDI